MIYSAFEMGECTGNEMEVEEVPLLEFPRHTKAGHSNLRNNGLKSAFS